MVEMNIFDKISWPSGSALISFCALQKKFSLFLSVQIFYSKTLTLDWSWSKMLKSPTVEKDTMLSRNQIPIIDVSFGELINN